MFISKEPTHTQSRAGKPLGTRDCHCLCSHTFIMLLRMSAIPFWGPSLPWWSPFSLRSAPIHASPMLTAVHCSLCFLPLLSPLALCKTRRLMSLLNTCINVGNSSAWASPALPEWTRDQVGHELLVKLKQKPELVQVYCLTGVPLNTREFCFVLFSKSTLVSSQYKLGKSQHSSMAWEMLPTGLLTLELNVSP